MFEYHVEDLSYRGGSAGAQSSAAEAQSSRFNELGREGWNLVTIVGTLAYFWRPRGQYSADLRAHIRLEDPEVPGA